jgi:hypothetical protein
MEFSLVLRKEHEARLLPENLPLSQTGKIKWASASELVEWVSTSWKNVVENRVKLQEILNCKYN